MDTSHFKQLLEAKQAALIAELQTVGVQDPKNPHDWVTTQTAEPEADLNDVADHTEAYDESRSILANLETSLNEVTAALERITQGTYGICIKCRQPIEVERLEAFPAAATCSQHTA